MNWWEWVFSGIGALILGLFIEKLRRRSRTSGLEATVTAKGAKVSGSPVASGTGITQVVTETHHHHYGPAEAPPKAPVELPLPQPEAVHALREALPSSQVIATATRLIRVGRWGQQEWSDRGPYLDQEALVIQFTNEIAPGYQNSQPMVRSSLVYSDEQNNEVLRITGGWVNEKTDLAPFRLEESHNLLVGIFMGGGLVALEYKSTPAVGGGEHCHMIPRPLAGFQQGTVRVRLTDIHSRTLLYEGYFGIGIDPLRITSRERGR
jgi:hypothetical protein